MIINLTNKERIKMKLQKYKIFNFLYKSPLDDYKNYKEISFETIKLIFQHQRYFNYLHQEFIDDVVNLEDNCKKGKCRVLFQKYKGNKYNDLPYKLQVILDDKNHVSYLGNHENAMDMIYAAIEQVKFSVHYQENYDKYDVKQ